MRPVAKVLAQQRQIKQPFSWIIEDFKVEFSGACDLPNQVAKKYRLGKTQEEADAPQIRCARRPVRRIVVSSTGNGGTAPSTGRAS